MTDCNSKVIVKAMQSKTEIFIQKAMKIHSGKYIYPNTNYVNNLTKVAITCLIHGDFYQSPSNHLKGKGCPVCANTKKGLSKQKTTDQFVLAARKIHGDKYDYSKTIYIKAMLKVAITCPDHGDFLQTPNSHLCGAGCAACNGGVKLTLKQFISKAINKHGDCYDYSHIRDYKNNQVKLPIRCLIHGVFYQSGNSHLNGNGCPECALKKCRDKIAHTTGKFIKRAILVHGDKYDYSLVNYLNCEEKVEIICRKHGAFWQAPKKHLKGQSCIECVKENPTFMFGRSSYVRYCKRSHNGVSRLYVLKCESEDELFYKIGITCQAVKDRFSGHMAMPYKFEILAEISGEAGFIYDLETQVHRILKVYCYQPKRIFGGHTECFSKITKPVERLIRQLKTTNQIQLIA